MIHELKTINPFFQKLAEGKKTFELRKNDRDFKIGDVLFLKEYDDINNEYKSGFIKRLITDITYHENFPEGIKEGYCILSLSDDLEAIAIKIAQNSRYLFKNIQR